MRSFANFVLLRLVGADIPEHIVDKLPGFAETSFKVYSGLLDVPGPILGFAEGGNEQVYDSLKIHYQFHPSQRDPTKDPVVTWHNGGPGSSSINVGLYTETGYFQIDEDGFRSNPFAWNRVANMLYFDSPAGSGDVHGSSVCMKGTTPTMCYWDDVTQAKAYARTLQAFYDAFPEFEANDLFLTGESYFGQYGPNIASYILDTEPFATRFRLKGMALGNACWGGSETDVQCRGPHEARNDMDFYYGKSLISKKAYQDTVAHCDFENVTVDCATKVLFAQISAGPVNLYNIYETCDDTAKFLKETGKDMPWLVAKLREGLHAPRQTHRQLTEMNGGYDWACGGMDAELDWIAREDVRKALHIDEFEAGASLIDYHQTGPAAIVLYPELAKKLRLLIYSGDSDLCVPYVSTEEWVLGLEEQGVLQETQAWTPWFASSEATAPAGYVTDYAVVGSDQDFSFATIRLAGHMVPTYQPEAAFSMFSRWLAEEPLAETKMLV